MPNRARPRPRPPSARCCGSSRTRLSPMPGWRRCCATSSRTPTSPRWRGGWPIRGRPRPRARLLFGLAHVLDARGDYARAADCLRQANALTLETAPRPAAYDPAEHTLHVDGLLAGVRCRVLRTHGRDGPGDAPAGLHLRPAAVGDDADRAGPGQPSASPRLPASSAWAAGRSRPFPTSSAVASGRWNAFLTSMRRRSGAWPSSTRATALHDGGRSARIVDKMPDNYLYLGLLAALFPAPVHPLPPRPPRRGRLVLDDRLPQHPLGQRPATHRRAGSANTAG